RQADAEFLFLRLRAERPEQEDVAAVGDVGSDAGHRSLDGGFGLVAADVTVFVLGPAAAFRVDREAVALGAAPAVVDAPELGLGREAYFEQRALVLFRAHLDFLRGRAR